MNNTPRMTALIESMLHGQGIPRCDEWDKLEHLARQLELLNAELVAALANLLRDEKHDDDDPRLMASREQARAILASALRNSALAGR